MTDPKAPGDRLARMLADPKSMLAFLDDAVIPGHCTPEMIADPSLGACKRMREGCIELGPWLPFYQGYVCGACFRADQAQLANGEYRKHGLPL